MALTKGGRNRRGGWHGGTHFVHEFQVKYLRVFLGASRGPMWQTRRHGSPAPAIPLSGSISATHRSLTPNLQYFRSPVVASGCRLSGGTDVGPARVPRNTSQWPTENPQLLKIITKISIPWIDAPTFHRAFCVYLKDIFDSGPVGVTGLGTGRSQRALPIQRQPWRIPWGSIT